MHGTQQYWYTVQKETQVASQQLPFVVTGLIPQGGTKLPILMGSLGACEARSQVLWLRDGQSTRRNAYALHFASFSFIAIE